MYFKFRITFYRLARAAAKGILGKSRWKELLQIMALQRGSSLPGLIQIMIDRKTNDKEKRRGD